jgi:glycosyltransferase involved in cell wall biosynthesis
MGVTIKGPLCTMTLSSEATPPVDELVSCVMATGNRPAFLRQAVRCFRRQTCRATELIVVDDSPVPAPDLAGLDPRIRYLHLDRRTPTGTKLNLGIDASRGTIVQKLDDDDFYRSGFVQLAAEHLRRARGQRPLVAWDCFLVWLAGEKRPRQSGHGWTVGGTFCFRRELWASIPFRDVPSAVDHWFLMDHQPDIVPVCAPEQYIVVRHGRNTWTLVTSGESGPCESADSYFSRLPVYEKPLDDLLDEEDRMFYESLAWSAL